MDFLSLRKQLIEKDFCGMNDMQFNAVTAVSGPLLVLAGAGSGKTTVLVNRIAALIKYGNAYNSDFIPSYTKEHITQAENYLSGKADVLPYGIFSVDAPLAYQILAITFTNKAAAELKERIEAKLGENSQGIWAGTFHSICGKILRMNAERIGFSSHFTIYDTDDQRRLMKELLKSGGIDDKMFPPKSILSAISSAKDSLIDPDEYEKTAGSDLRRKTVATLYRQYQRRLREADAMDFDDMISNTVRLFNENPDVLEKYGSRFRYIMVDEYQDTNHAQYVLISLLASVHRNICVVGDDDQSIYRFRGATIENILNFEDDFPGAKVIRLEQNYRSTGNILNAANAVIKNNEGRKGKTLWTSSDDGDKLTVFTASDAQSEARYVADEILNNVRNNEQFKNHAVLYRINAQSAAIENVFVRSGISYRIIGGHKFYDRKEIKDVLAYLNLINNRSDNLRLKRIINEPRRGIGEATVSKGSEIAEQLGISLFEVFSRADEFAAISRAAVKLKEFCSLIEGLAEAAEDISISELLNRTLELTGYRMALLTDTQPDAPDRLANVEEFIGVVNQFELDSDEPSLSAFLEEIALVNDTDSLDSSDDKVVLMTIHSAKGLEFDNVFLIGMEEGIFPGNQSIFGGREDMEEERRLAYVAITRAKKKLTVTNAAMRMLYGSTTRNLPSRFIKEIPEEFCEIKSVIAAPFTETRFEAQTKSHSLYSHTTKWGSSSQKAFVGGPSQKTQKSELPSYASGQMVEHKTFGRGMIINVTPMSNDVLLEVAFDTAGTKKLMANFAKLKII